MGTSGDVWGSGGWLASLSAAAQYSRHSGVRPRWMWRACSFLNHPLFDARRLGQRGLMQRVGRDMQDPVGGELWEGAFGPNCDAKFHPFAPNTIHFSPSTMAPKQNFIDPNAYNHLQTAVQRAHPNPPSTVRPPASVAARTRHATRGGQINATTHVTEPEHLEIQRFEDPNAPDPGEKGDMEYEVPGKKRKKKGCASAAKVAPPTTQHHASQTPAAPVQSIPTLSPSAPACTNLPSSLTAPHAPSSQSHFQSLASSGPLNYANQTIPPTTTQGYATVYTQPLPSTTSSGTGGFTMNMSGPFSIWLVSCIVRC